MAGDPLNGGGFVIINGVQFSEIGRIHELETPYPGGNLFSLASGGAVYIRDPYGRVGTDQLNGGQFATVAKSDWDLILPYLEENRNLFGIDIESLLKIEGRVAEPSTVYRKVEAVPLKALATTD